ncbi:nicotinamide N-methyltransferase [Malassezia vespertilionis]|uniref:nicotinamide N-methyltransferase n=1 Tax=Malassezia vespertilionis TaxID=2020962 RepID=UPI0024B20515|nr:nicotinamide N-methyltransferase [Malassezia vespertilionis]WFD08417.1 nicotinamide N-methyltransferase [Malassezia vespertilionis]
MADLDIFEDALLTVFDYHQPAHGDPGSDSTYTHTQLPSWCDVNGTRTVQYRIPNTTSTNTKLFAHHQWDAGIHLANLLASAVSGDGPAWADPRAKCVVELGAGTGLPGLVAAALGARSTVLTDYPDTEILANLAANAAALKKRAPLLLPLQTMGLAWGDAAQEAYVVVC